MEHSAQVRRVERVLYSARREWAGWLQSQKGRRERDGDRKCDKNARSDGREAKSTTGCGGRPPGRRRTRARRIGGVRNGGRGESGQREWKGEEGKDIYRRGDKAGCLFPRGAPRLVFLFFQIDVEPQLIVFCLLSATITPSLPLLHPSHPRRRLSYCLPAGQRGGWASVVCARHWLHLLNAKCHVVPLRFGEGEGRASLAYRCSQNIRQRCGFFFLNSADYKLAK